MKPLISYYGGKQRMAPKIIPLIPPHSVYVEPFCGGAAVFFAKGRKVVTNNNHYREVLNDSNGAIVNLYRVAKTQPDALIEMLDATPYALSEYRRSVEILRNLDRYSDLQRAWACCVNANVSFANKMFGGWGRNRQGYNSAAGWHKHRQRIPEIVARLNDVYIDEIDAIECIDKWDSENTFFYCDPPYPGTSCGHYEGYTIADYRRLVDRLSTIKGKFMLSNYAQNVDMPSDWEMLSFSATASSAAGKNGAGKNKRTELVIMNYEQPQIRIAL